MREPRYRIWLIGEVEGGGVDLRKTVVPTEAERRIFDEFEPTDREATFHRLEADFLEHPKGAIVRYDGYSVLLIATELV